MDKAFLKLLGKQLLLEHFWESSTDNLFIMTEGRNGRFFISDINTAQARMLPISAAEAQDKYLHEVVDEAAALHFEQQYRTCLQQQQPISYQESAVVRGEEFHWDTRLAPFTDKHGTRHIFGIARDITELVRIQQQLESLNHNLEATVAERTQELEALNRELERRAYTDQLTGVGNRDLFFTKVQPFFEHQQGLHSMLYIDIDHFKAINDRHGHSVGDEVLVWFAQRLSESVRPDDILARFGGEEFVVFLPETPLQEALRLAEQIQQSVESQVCAPESQRIPVCCSIGVAENGDLNEPLDALIKRADTALYQAKRDGRCCIRY